jgi:hypothetical protein
VPPVCRLVSRRAVGVDCFGLANDVVNDVRKRCGGVDRDAVRDVFSASMQSHDEIAFRLLCAPFVFRALIESLFQCLEIYLKHEDPVEQVYELRKVARAAAKKVRRS